MPLGDDPREVALRVPNTSAMVCIRPVISAWSRVNSATLSSIS
jgi:hypothetical protein